MMQTQLRPGVKPAGPYAFYLMAVSGLFVWVDSGQITSAPAPHLVPSMLRLMQSR